MAKTSAEIQAQISKLQRDLEVVRAREVKEVVDRIRGAIAHYGLTADDLFGGRRTKRANAKAAEPKAKPRKLAAKKAKRSSSAGIKVAVKFKDGAGNTWTGRGNQPRWLKAALAEGKSIEDFRLAN